MSQQLQQLLTIPGQTRPEQLRPHERRTLDAHHTNTDTHNWSQRREEDALSHRWDIYVTFFCKV